MSSGQQRRGEGRPASRPSLEIALERFREFLRDNGLKFTHEREQILGSLLELDQHVDADELLVRMRRSGSKVSRATIYRTLDLLVQAGLARKVRLGGEHHHFEHIFGRRQHEHMICVQCGRIIEWYDPALARVIDDNLREQGFVASRWSVQVIGRCSDCANSGSGTGEPAEAASRR